MRITGSVRYIGVNDHQTDLFEGQYQVPNGMAYNSYVILDEKTAVMDTVDERFAEEWLAHLEAELSGRKPDYLLFSADAFGKFGALDTEEDWACEARRYYIGIVGKYGMQVQTVLKKAVGLDIQTICPLHGPVLTENLEYYINLYDIWSS